VGETGVGFSDIVAREGPQRGEKEGYMPRGPIQGKKKKSPPRPKMQPGPTFKPGQTNRKKLRGKKLQDKRGVRRGGGVGNAGPKSWRKKRGG